MSNRLESLHSSGFAVGQLARIHVAFYRPACSMSSRGCAALAGDACCVGWPRWTSRQCLTVAPIRSAPTTNAMSRISSAVILTAALPSLFRMETCPVSPLRKIAPWNVRQKAPHTHSPEPGDNGRSPRSEIRFRAISFPSHIQH